MNTIFETSGILIQIYYLIVSVFLLYSVYKYKRDYLNIFIVLVFFLGLFVFMGKTVQNSYRILMLLFSMYLAYRSNSITKFNNNKTVFYTFILFSGVFITFSLYNRDNLFLILSQYSRYFMIYMLFFIVQKGMKYPSFAKNTTQLLFYLIIMQIILTVVKFIVTGPMESIVGSIGYSGGAMSTTLPLLGFMFLWTIRNGNFSKKDWLITLGLTFIGFVGYKRAIWFMMPILISLFMFYVRRRKITNRILFFTLFLIPIVLYLGIRLNPTLNKDHTVWGTFDIEYTLNYVSEYSFGSQEKVLKSEDEKIAYGRGGATLSLFNKITNNELDSRDWTGYGLNTMYVEGAENDEWFSKKFKLNGIGAATGFFQNYIVSGFIGVLVTLLFFISIVYQTRNKRLRYVLLFFMLWEYFFYTGVLFRETPLAFILIYITLYANQYLDLSNNNKIKLNVKKIQTTY
jgi:hypothetical protein